MPRTSKKRLAELRAINLQAAEARLQIVREAGFNYFKESPDELMTVVHRHASNLYHSKDETLAFAYGYLEARLQRDEYLREKGSQS